MEGFFVFILVIIGVFAVAIKHMNAKDEEPGDDSWIGSGRRGSRSSATRTRTVRRTPPTGRRSQSTVDSPKVSAVERPRPPHREDPARAAGLAATASVLAAAAAAQGADGEDGPDAAAPSAAPDAQDPGSTPQVSPAASAPPDGVTVGAGTAATDPASSDPASAEVAVGSVYTPASSSYSVYTPTSVYESGTSVLDEDEDDSPEAGASA